MNYIILSIIITLGLNTSEGAVQKFGSLCIDVPEILVREPDITKADLANIEPEMESVIRYKSAVNSSPSISVIEQIFKANIQPNLSEMAKVNLETIKGWFAGTAKDITTATIEISGKKTVHTAVKGLWKGIPYIVDSYSILDGHTVRTIVIRVPVKSDLATTQKILKSITLTSD